MSNGVRCMIMRGGTSKGAFFVETDLPSEDLARDQLLMQVMGTPDPRQVDGIGGAHPLTSKVAIVSLPDDDEVDVGGAERKRLEVALEFFVAALEHAAIDEELPAGMDDAVAGTGDGAGRPVKDQRDGHVTSDGLALAELLRRTLGEDALQGAPVHVEPPGGL